MANSSAAGSRVPDGAAPVAAPPPSQRPPEAPPAPCTVTTSEPPPPPPPPPPTTTTTTSTAPTTRVAVPPTSDTSSSGGARRVLICLLRLDLRIYDNALFTYAHQTAPPPVLPHREHFNRSKDPGERDLYSQSEYLLPLYVFDERDIELSGLPGYARKGPEARTPVCGFWKTGAFRARFISESVYDLRTRLRDVGSDLMIRFGTTEDVVENVVKAFQAQGDEVEGVWMQKEMTHDEAQVEVEIRSRLEGTGVPVRFVHGKTLVHAHDLPHEISETPDVFTPFRKRVEALGEAMVRPTLRPPRRFKPFPPFVPSTPDYALDVSYEVDVDGLADRAPEPHAKASGQTSFHDILRYLLLPLNDRKLPPTLEGSSLLQQRHPASAFPLRGGESAALERLEWYFVRGKSADSSRWGKADPPPVSRYKQTRNNLLGHAYSTKMSPFLAYGSISPRQVWEALDAHEAKFGEDQNTYWVRFELLWRDYFFFVAEKYGDLLFEPGGFESATNPKAAQAKVEGGWWKEWRPQRDGGGRDHCVTRLLEGRTGIPFIDANVIELLESGFMSNRGRQNVASFLTKDLVYDWRIGAEFFQSHLIDYDATSNYGNWQYVAGVGNDPRASRQFNVVKQAKDYDSHGQFVKTWIPALRNLHADHVHTPWLLADDELRAYGVKPTRADVHFDAYPRSPVVEAETWRKHYDRKEGVGSRMFGNSAERLKGKQFKRRAAASTSGAAAGGGGGGKAKASASAPSVLGMSLGAAGGATSDDLPELGARAGGATAGNSRPGLTKGRTHPRARGGGGGSGEGGGTPASSSSSSSSSGLRGGIFGRSRTVPLGGGGGGRGEGVAARPLGAAASSATNGAYGHDGPTSSGRASEFPALGGSADGGRGAVGAGGKAANGHHAGPSAAATPMPMARAQASKSWPGLAGSLGSTTTMTNRAREGASPTWSTLGGPRAPRSGSPLVASGQTHADGGGSGSGSSSHGSSRGAGGGGGGAGVGQAHVRREHHRHHHGDSDAKSNGRSHGLGNDDDGASGASAAAAAGAGAGTSAGAPAADGRRRFSATPSNASTAPTTTDSGATTTASSSSSSSSSRRSSAASRASSSSSSTSPASASQGDSAAGAAAAMMATGMGGERVGPVT